MYALRFAIDTRPVCIWLTDPRERSQEFLRRMDPLYFEYVAKVHADQLGGEEEQAAALSLRMAYGHALEAFFAFLGATVQAPECVYGWLAEYRNAELRSLVEKITNGAPLLSKLRMSAVTWERLAVAVHEPLVLKDKNKEAQVKEGFGRMWRRFARDFLDRTSQVEYNSIKHGFRAKAGGFSISIGEEETPGVPCPPERMVSIGGSEFGSTFFVNEPLGRSRMNMRTRRRARNWTPVDLANGLCLVSMSLKNVVTRLRAHAGESPEVLKFSWPSDLGAFEAPWKSMPTVFESSFDDEFDASRLRLLTKEEILSAYDPPRSRGSRGRKGSKRSKPGA